MAANERILLTPLGKQELEEELAQLRDEELPTMNQRIHELSESGDVSDDSDFELTKEEFIQLEARIREIKLLLEDAEIIEPSDGIEVVSFGSTVTVVDESGAEDTWMIVGRQEANTAQGRISTESPVGSALMGKRIGEKVTVSTPGGDMVFEVKGVQ